MVERLAHDLAEADEGDKVREDHYAVEEVGKLPDQIKFERGAEDDEGHDRDTVGRKRLIAKEELHVLLAEEVPADDRREGEEEHTYRDEGQTEGAET